VLSARLGKSPGAEAVAARPAAPFVAQLAEPQENRLRIRILWEIRERLAQTPDHRRAGQPEERVDFPLQRQGGDQRFRGILFLHPRQYFPGLGVIRLAVESKAEIARDVVVPGIDQRLLGQFRELVDKSVVQLVRMAAVMAIASTGVEQRIAAE